MAAFTLSVEPSEVEPRRAVPLRFRILGPDGEPVTDLLSLHERNLHVIVVRHDLATFAHLHPDRAPDGTWHVDLALPSPGPYRAFADLAPVVGMRSPWRPTSPRRRVDPARAPGAGEDGPGWGLPGRAHRGSDRRSPFGARVHRDEGR